MGSKIIKAYISITNKFIRLLEQIIPNWHVKYEWYLCGGLTKFIRTELVIDSIT